MSTFLARVFLVSNFSLCYLRQLPQADVKSKRVQAWRGRFIVSDGVCCLENMLEDAESVVLSAATRCNLT